MHTLTLENGQNDPLRISNKIIDSHLRQKVCMIIEFHVQLMSYFVITRCLLDQCTAVSERNAKWKLKLNKFEMLGPKMEDKCPLASPCSANYFLIIISFFMRKSIVYSKKIGRNLHSKNGLYSKHSIKRPVRLTESLEYVSTAISCLHIQWVQDLHEVAFNLSYPDEFMKNFLISFWILSTA